MWAAHAGAGNLHLLVDDDAGVLARRATGFAHPPVVWPPVVWQVTGRELVAAGVDTPLGPVPMHADVAARAGVLRAAGADPVAEDGMLLGEVLGLEVARVTRDQHGVRLEVGVGKHDRQAQTLVHGDRPTHDVLAAAVATVLRHRRSDAPRHPLNRLAPERWLRAHLVAHPELVGARWLAPVPSPARLDDLRLPAPAPARGVDLAGEPLVVVCSTGIDLELVPVGVDVRLCQDPLARLVLVVPQRDDHPALRVLAATLAGPAEVVTVPDDWRAGPKR